MAEVYESTASSGPEVLLRLTALNIPARPCMLLGIAHGKVHLRSDWWIEPASPVSAKFAHLSLPGEVLYCTRKDTWYRTCIELSQDGQRRREPRLVVRQRGAFMALAGDGKESSTSGMIIDVAVSGMRLEIPHAVEIGTMIYIETESNLMAGEVRNCRAAASGHFEAGVEITDVFSSGLSPQPRPGMMKSLGSKLARVIWRNQSRSSGH